MSTPPGQRLTLYDRLLSLFGVRITWEWCLVGCTIGRHSWSLSQEKCRNGTPVISGGFLEVWKFSSEEDARAMLPRVTEAARLHNEAKGYWT